MYLEEFSIKKVSVRVFLEENYREQHFLIRKFVFSILISLISIVKFELTNFLSNAQRVKFNLLLIIVKMINFVLVHFVLTKRKLTEYENINRYTR